MAVPTYTRVLTIACSNDKCSRFGFSIGKSLGVYENINTAYKISANINDKQLDNEYVNKNSLNCICRVEVRENN